MSTLSRRTRRMVANLLTLIAVMCALIGATTSFTDGLHVGGWLGLTLAFGFAGMLVHPGPPR